MWQTIKQFFIDNQSSIIISLLIGGIFFVLGPLGLWFSGKKVKREKINKAKAEFLDLIESMLVNEEDVTKSKLLTLFRAIERQNNVNLELDSDIQDLLEDLSLRFARSKHLAAEQKDDYANRIDQLINNLEEKEPTNEELPLLLKQREIPKSLKSILNDLKEESEKMDNKELQDKIELLEKYHTRPQPLDPFLMAARLMREKPQIFIWFIAIYIAVILLLIYFDVLN